MIVTANCKINIGLDILRRRTDGYHEVETIMYPVRGLYDTLAIDANGSDRPRLRVEGIEVDCAADDNICMRAWAIMRQRFGIGGVDIVLRKQIPFGAGLGGGSADGTAVLKALNTIFDLHLSDNQLIELASTFGSDTPFFVRNTPQLCTGRGEIVTPVDLSLSGLTLVVVKPDEGVSTREAYSGVTPSVPAERLSDLVQQPVAQWRGRVKNDFERSIFATHPRIAALKEALYAQGALYASMSGSGSALFGLFAGDVEFVPPFGGVFVHRERL